MTSSIIHNSLLAIPSSSSSSSSFLPLILPLALGQSSLEALAKSPPLLLISRQHQLRLN